MTLSSRTVLTCGLEHIKHTMHALTYIPHVTCWEHDTILCILLEAYFLSNLLHLNDRCFNPSPIVLEDLPISTLVRIMTKFHDHMNIYNHMLYQTLP